MEQEGPWDDEVSVSLNNLHSCKFPQTHAELKAEIQTHRIVSNAVIKNINVLLVGEISSGKSSFFNTVESGFAGYVTTRADTGIDTTSITKKVLFCYEHSDAMLQVQQNTNIPWFQFRQYTIKARDGNNKPINFKYCDTMGLETDGVLSAADFGKILDGHVEEGFEVSPKVPIM